jgi:hypothetical protein
VQVTSPSEPLTNSQSLPVLCLSTNRQHPLTARSSAQSDSLSSAPYAGSSSAENDSCVVNRASRFLCGAALLSSFTQFRRLRQAACTIPALGWILTLSRGDESQVLPNFASPALPEDAFPISFESRFGGLRAPLRISGNVANQER